MSAVSLFLGREGRPSCFHKERGEEERGREGRRGKGREGRKI
jgi:hypothetical protein